MCRQPERARAGWGGACNGAAFHVGAVQTREMAIPGGTVHALQVDDGPGRDCPRSAGG